MRVHELNMAVTILASSTMPSRDYRDPIPAGKSSNDFLQFYGLCARPGSESHTATYFPTVNIKTQSLLFFFLFVPAGAAHLHRLSGNPGV